MEPTPTDSRYIPFTQQPYCCTPTCIQVVMYKLGLPLISQEELGYYLGLIVPPKEKELFWNVRVSDTPPTAAGYGTQIQKREYDLNQAFDKLKVPLAAHNLIDNFDSIDDVRSYLKKVEQYDRDVVVCFRYGTLHNTDSRSGHVNVFDRYLADTDEVRLIDPAVTVPKWRVVPLRNLFKAVKEHSSDNGGGFWEVERV